MPLGATEEDFACASVPLRDLARPRCAPLPRPLAGLLEDAPAVAGPDGGGRAPDRALQVRRGRTPALRLRIRPLGAFGDLWRRPGRHAGDGGRR